LGLGSPNTRHKFLVLWRTPSQRYASLQSPANRCTTVMQMQKQGLNKRRLCAQKQGLTEHTFWMHSLAVKIQNISAPRDQRQEDIHRSATPHPAALITAQRQEERGWSDQGATSAQTAPLLPTPHFLLPTVPSQQARAKNIHSEISTR